MVSRAGVNRRPACQRRRPLASRRPALLLFTLVLFPALLAGQPRSVITGKVVDAESGKALEFVNVFLANTTRGSATGENGRYRLAGIPPGVYRLVASRVGYDVGVIRLQITGDDTMRQDFRLTARQIRSDEVEVLAEGESEWRRTLRLFEEQFLGTDPFAGDARIENPEVLDFRRDSTGALIASTDSVLRVLNEGLGYRLHIDLVEFSWNDTSRAVSYVLYVRFEDIAPADSDDAREIFRNRKEAYRGSLRHFLHSLATRRLGQEAFMVFDQAGATIGPGGRGLVFDAESGFKKVLYGGVLRVEYRGSTRVRNNLIRFATGIIILDPSGTPTESQDLIIDPSSAWAGDRVARMVPVDFELE